MNGGRTLLDVAAIEGFINNLSNKKSEIDAEYQKMRQAADDLGSVAFKGDIVSKINDAKLLNVIKKQQETFQQLQTILAKLRKVNKNS